MFQNPFGGRTGRAVAPFFTLCLDFFCMSQVRFRRFPSEHLHTCLSRKKTEKAVNWHQIGFQFRDQLLTRFFFTICS